MTKNKEDDPDLRTGKMESDEDNREKRGESDEADREKPSHYNVELLDATNQSHKGNKEELELLLQNIKDQNMRAMTREEDFKKELALVKQEKDKEIEANWKVFMQEINTHKDHLTKEQERFLAEKAKHTKALEDLEILSQQNKELTERIEEKDVHLLQLEQDNKKILKETETIERQQKEKNKIIERLRLRNTQLDDNIKVKNKSIEDYKKNEADFQSTITELGKEKELIQKKLDDETLPKNILKNSALQKLVDRLPEGLRPILAPKGSVKGDELGTFLGTLVTTTAYNVTYSNKSTTGMLIGNSLANMLGTIIGQVCNNVVTHMSHTNLKEEGMDLAVAFKSVFWILLGGLIPAIAGGVCKTFLWRAVVSALVALVMKGAMATLWQKSYDVPVGQVAAIVGFGIFGIAVAALIPMY